MRAASNPRPRVRAAVAAGAALVVALGVAACGGGGGDDGPGSKRLNLVIGNLLPLSGPSGQLGESGAKASKLAVIQIKLAIDESGTDHRVRVIQRDEGTTPDSAADAAKKLTSAGANCLTGPWSAGAVERTANDVAIPARTPEISPVPATREVTELSDHDLVNSTALPVSTEGKALADAIEQELGGADGRTVNLAAAEDEYGTTLSEDFTKEWQDRDGSIGGDSPDAELVIGDPSGFTQLASQLPGWDPGIAWGSDQLVDPGLRALAGPQTVDGMRALAPGTPESGDARALLVQEFGASPPHDVELEPYAAQEYDATILCYLAAVAAGSTDGQQMADELVDITAPGGPRFDWRQLPAAIRALQDGEDIDFEGISGPLDLDVQGNPTRGVFDVYRYTDRGLEVVGEVAAEKPNPATP